MARKREASPTEAAPLTLTPGAEIARLALAPGEILVVKLDRSIATWEVAERMRDYLAGVIPPGVKCLVIDDRVELSVLKPETT